MNNQDRKNVMELLKAHSSGASVFITTEGMELLEKIMGSHAGEEQLEEAVG